MCQVWIRLVAALLGRNQLEDGAAWLEALAVLGHNHRLRVVDEVVNSRMLLAGVGGRRLEKGVLTGIEHLIVGAVGLERSACTIVHYLVLVLLPAHHAWSGLELLAAHSWPVSHEGRSAFRGSELRNLMSLRSGRRSEIITLRIEEGRHGPLSLLSPVLV